MAASKKYFKLFANCIITRGFNKSIICDMQRRCYFIIPNELADLLKEYENLLFDEFIKKQTKYSGEDFLSLIDSLINNNIGHFCSDPNDFPNIEMARKTPYLIHDAILEISEMTLTDIEDILESLTLLGCEILELRCYEATPLKGIERILALSANTTIKNIELVIKESENEPGSIEGLLKYPVLNAITFHSCAENKARTLNDFRVKYTTQRIDSNLCCGNVSKECFKVNLPFYIDSLKNNSCLSKKISITSNGDIKNCPSLKTAYGNIKNKKLIDAYNDPNFKNLWTISKDEIEVCKDCEFRYICTDCRAFTEDPDNLKSKPLKCGYDPYKGIWFNWKEKPLKTSNINHYYAGSIDNR
jgi:SPASM domain peptide maturase of grasp-with-spasm system